MMSLPTRTLPVPRRRSRAAASSLLVAILVMSVLVVIASVAFDYTGGNGRYNNRSRTYFSAQTVAESGLERMYANWRSMLVNNPNLFPSTSQLRAGGSNNIVSPVPDATDHPGFASYIFDANLGGYDIQALDTFYVRLGDANAAPPPVQTPAAGRPGWTTNSRNYLATATVRTQGFGASTDVNSKLEMIFTQQSTSVFQAAIFYQNEMEIHPGPAFTITGLVHSNGSIYAAHDTLTFGGNVSFVGSLNNNFMPGDSRLGTETPGQYREAAGIQKTKVDPLEPIADDPSSVFNTTDANVNNDGYREMIEIPNTNQADPPQIAGIRMYNKAALKVRITAAPPAPWWPGAQAPVVTVLRRDGTAIATNNPLYRAVRDSLALDQPITNAREGGDVVDLDTIDVAKLNTAIKQMNDAAQSGDRFNGVLYIADERTSDTDPKAIRLKNGSVLPDGTNSAGSQASTVGLTVASQNPVYIQGDYNTGTSTPSQVPSNGNPGDLTKPQVDNYTRKPAAVMSDSVNILSNSWDDTKSALGLSSRVASSTTINTAILTGNVPTNYDSATGRFGAEAGGTGNGRYSGGVENFPRFLEEWSGKRLTYYGSMVQMFISKQETGPWGSENVYGAPNRNWYFDELFRQNPPPGFVNFPNFSKGRWARK